MLDWTAWRAGFEGTARDEASSVLRSVLMFVLDGRCRLGAARVELGGAAA
jgi:hypothetical protein